MQNPARRLVALAALSLAAAAASAQSWPTQPIRWIAPYPAGGGTDVVARTVASGLEKPLGQTIVVENRPGAALLLPRRLRGAVTDIYRFARAADDIADEGSATDDERLAQLAAFRTELHRIGAEPGTTPPPGLPPLADIFTPLAKPIAQRQQRQEL
ncbi:hypothetical protein G6F40_015993 [Rhizopus arrhizus]|nr:hypothetical protein G6F40_015993 [Rhizopus arrhizus]